MAVYESYTADVEAFSYDNTNARRNGQGFTPSTSHKIESVKLYLRKIGSPTNGDISVSIKAADGSGLPTGTDLTAGTISSSIISTWGWHEISLASYTLNSGTTYCIVSYFANGDASNYIDSSLNNGNPYGSGVASRSVDSGSTWNEEVGFDFHFQDIGSGGFIPKVFIL